MPYITTAIAYPNANAHLGHALEFTIADYYARYWRQRNLETYFLTGTDEHGVKIQKKAQEKGLSEMQFVDQMSGQFKELIKSLSISADRFIRTTDEDHIKIASALWNKCLVNGDIYKQEYQAWYNFKEEEFIGLVSDIPDPASIGLNTEFIEKIDEVNYFFRLSKYQDKIVDLIESGKYKITPQNRKLEVLNFIKQKGLSDISISRESSKLSWGIPVPGDDSQVMYVWFDALTNYLSAVAEVDAKGEIVPNGFWPADIHVVGKDIQRFHAVIWPGMLLSAGLPTPKELLVHGFITNDGIKMSKSIGNVVDPVELLNSMGINAVRWFLLKEVPTTDDKSFTDERFNQIYNSDLANSIGNLVSRTVTMVGKYYQGIIPSESDGEAKIVVEKAWKEYEKQVELRRVDLALVEALGLAEYCNKRIDDEKPWVLAKDEGSADTLAKLMYQLMEIVRHINLMLEPALPDVVSIINDKIFKSLSFPNFQEAQKWGGLPAGYNIGDERIILFPKIND